MYCMSCPESSVASSRMPPRANFARLALCCILVIVGPMASAQMATSPVSVAASQAVALDVQTPSASSTARSSVKVEAGRISGSIPVKRESEPEGGATWGVPQLLLAVAVLGGLLWWLPKRLRARSSSGGSLNTRMLSRMVGQKNGDHPRVLSSSRLVGKASLHVIEWDHQQWLVGCTEHHVSVLAKRPVDASAVPGASSVSGAGHE